MGRMYWKLFSAARSYWRQLLDSFFL
jgi:hypothetical protein